MNTATYTNQATNETYRIKSELEMTLEMAWNLASFVCSRMNWNLSMFCNDVKVRISK